MKFKYGTCVIDDESFIALLGNILILSNGDRIRLDEESAKALRGCFPEHPKHPAEEEEEGEPQ